MRQRRLCVGGDFCLVLKDGWGLARRGKERGQGGGESKGRVWGELCGVVLRGLVWLEQRLKCRVDTGLGRREPSNGGSLNSRQGVWTPCGGTETGLLLEGEMSRRGQDSERCLLHLSEIRWAPLSAVACCHPATFSADSAQCRNGYIWGSSWAHH